MNRQHGISYCKIRTFCHGRLTKTNYEFYVRQSTFAVSSKHDNLGYTDR